MDRTRLACSNLKKLRISWFPFFFLSQHHGCRRYSRANGNSSFHTPIQQSSAAFRCSSSMKYEHTKVAAANKLNVPRRLLLQFAIFSPVSLKVSPVLGAPTPETKQPEVIRTTKFASGVRIQDIVDGEGVEAKEGNFVEVNYVCRRANGYFVHSTVDQFSGESSPVILPLDEKQIIKGLKEVLVGMKVGGKRRALIPPSVGYTTENLMPIPDEFGPRRSLLSHANEPLIFEVQLLKVLRSS